MKTFLIYLAAPVVSTSAGIVENPMEVTGEDAQLDSDGVLEITNEEGDCVARFNADRWSHHIIKA